MKKIIAVSLLLAGTVSSVYAQDFPVKKGDFIIYEIRGRHSENPLKIKKRIIDLKRGESGEITQVLSQKTLLHEDGTEENMGLENELYAFVKEKYISDIKKYCARAKGTLEEIEVVAGRFLACKTSFLVRGRAQEVVTRWMGEKVPFGVVKEMVNVSSEGAEERFELWEFGSK